MKSPRDVIQSIILHLQETDALTPAKAGEMYEILPVQHMEMMEWAQAQVQQLIATAPHDPNVITAQLYFILLFGAALHKEGIIP